MCLAHADLHSKCYHPYKYLILDPCEVDLESYLLYREYEDKNYQVSSYSLNTQAPYCNKCRKIIRRGDDRIVEYFFKTHIHLMRLLLDRRLPYSNFRAATNSMIKDREIELHAHYCKYGLFRPSDYAQCAIGCPTEESFRNDEARIRADLSAAEEEGLFECFAPDFEDESDDDEMADVSHGLESPPHTNSRSRDAYYVLDDLFEGMERHRN